MEQEIAWDARGVWCGDGRSRKAPRLNRHYKHQGCDRATCGKFQCSACKRIAPWCWGMDRTTVCDQCPDKPKSKRRRKGQRAGI